MSNLPALQDLVRDYTFIALIPPIALTFDYVMTFTLAGSHAVILQYEVSPVIRAALAVNMVRVFYLILFGTYYVATFLVLRFLHGTDIYPFGVAVVLIVSLCHVLGGLSWVFRNEIYSQAIAWAALLATAATCSWFVLTIYRGHRLEAGRDIKEVRAEILR